MGSRALWVVVAVVLVLGLAAGAYYLVTRGEEQPVVPPVVPEEPTTWPLTGEEAEEDAEIDVRVLSVKVDNNAAARPQSGLAGADVVYEILAEGGITRFHAIFHSRVSDQVGPIRSARLPDIRLVQLYDSILLFSGANRQVIAAIDQSGIQTLDETTGGRAFQRSAQRSAPHNLYADLPAAREVATERDFESLANPPTLQFGEPSIEASEAAEADVPINELNRVVWRWTGERYERELNGQPHGDEGGDDAYSAANVVLLFAESQGDRPGTVDILLDGSGEAVLFRDGRRYEATWAAAERAPLRLTASDGSDLPLAVGGTWIEVLPAEDAARFDR